MRWCFGRNELVVTRDHNDIEPDTFGDAVADAFYSGSRDARPHGPPDTRTPATHGNTVRDPAGRWRGRRRRQLRCAERR